MSGSENNKVEDFIKNIKENPDNQRNIVVNVVIKSIQNSSREKVESILNAGLQTLVTIEHITSHHIRGESEREKRIGDMTLEKLGVVIEGNTVYLDNVDTGNSQGAYNAIKEIQKLIEQRKGYGDKIIKYIHSILGGGNTFDIRRHGSSYITKKNLELVFKYFGYHTVLTEIETIDDYRKFFESTRGKEQITSWGVKTIKGKLDFRVSFSPCAPALIPAGNYTLVNFLETIPAQCGIPFSGSDRTDIDKVQKFMRIFFRHIGYSVSEETEIPTEELTDYIDFFESDLGKTQLQDTHNITLKDNKVIFPGEDCLEFNTNIIQTSVRKTCIDILGKMEEQGISTGEYSSQQFLFGPKDFVKIMTLFFEHFGKEVIIQKKEVSD